MAFYIGGDTQELEFDFFTKTAGSVADCPMKIYKGEVDPDALPAPTDALWKEITSQQVIDKLKVQNELVTSNLATDKSTIQWGDKTLTKTDVIKVVDDFSGKVSGSLIENPNIIKYANPNTLYTPSSFNLETTSGYSNISALDDTVTNLYAATGDGSIPQMLFSFNLIEIIERKFGTIPKETVAEKVEWLKTNLSGIGCNWYGYGVCPTGNKAYLDYFSSLSNTWALYSSGLQNGYKNTSSTPTMINVSSQDINNKIDANGFAHFLVYTDARDSTTQSKISTDYISIELTLKSPENMITATNTIGGIVTDFSGKVSGSLVANVNVAKWNSDSGATALLTPSNWLGGEFVTADYSRISSADGTTQSCTKSLSGGIPQQLFSFNIIAAVEKHLGQPIPATDKVQWCKDNIYNIKPEWRGYGTCPSGHKAYLKAWNLSNNSAWSTGLSNTSSSPSTLTTPYNLAVQIANLIQSDGTMHLLACTDASNGVTASTIYTDFVELTIDLKYIPTYDFYTDSNSRRDAGLTNVVLIKRAIGDMVSDFEGKVAGSVVENPNIFCPNNGYTTLQAPANYTETSVYTGLDRLDNINRPVSATVNGAIASSLFSFNLIAIAEKQLGTSIPCDDTASKVAWLKENLAGIRGEWYGYGVCPTGYKAYFKRWVGSSWYGTVSNTSSSPTSLIHSTGNGDCLMDDGMAYFLAYTDASNGTTTSTINTDYIFVKLAFKTDTIGYEYFTNNSSEISVTTNNKSSAFLIECDLTPICNALYGGSNSALRSALKSIQADVWAMGSGSNVNQLSHEVRVGYWRSSDSIYAYHGQNPSTLVVNSTSSSIAKMTSAIIYPNDAANRISASNKLYVIVNSIYKSNGVIPSEVNLDYVNIKINLTRTPDVISPIPITLGDTWSILMKGISPSWITSEKGGKDLVFISMFNNLHDRINFANASNGKFGLTLDGKDGYLNSDLLEVSQTKKYQCFNLLIQQTSTGFDMFLLKNNEAVIKKSIINTNKFMGSYPLNILQYSADVKTYNGDSFLENLYFFNNKTFTDVEAEAMLKGTKEGFENPNLVPLFSDNLWTKHANAIVSNDRKTLTLNATANWTLNNTRIPIIPNNRYHFKASSSGKIEAFEYCNDVKIKTIISDYGPISREFVTNSKATNLRISLSNGSLGAGTFTFSDLELRRLD